MRPTVLVLAVLVLSSVSLPAGAEETYFAQSYCAWDDEHLEVVIVPPLGPYALYNEGDSIVVDADHSLIVAPETTLLWDSAHAYAAGAAVDAWEEALHAWAAQPGQAHLSRLTLDWSILGPGYDPAALAGADVVVFFTPVDYVGGATLVNCESTTAQPIVASEEEIALVLGTHIRLNQWFVLSFTPNDTYNIMVHEFGHALGLEHIDAPEGDIMNSVYPYTVGAIENPRECLSSLDVKQVANGFQWMDGTSPFRSPPPPTLMPASEYVRSC